MLVILKIPVVYLCAVVWWAIKAEPRPHEGAGTVASLGPRGGVGLAGTSRPSPPSWAACRGVAVVSVGLGGSPTPARG